MTTRVELRDSSYTEYRSSMLISRGCMAWAFSLGCQNMSVEMVEGSSDMGRFAHSLEEVFSCGEDLAKCLLLTEENLLRF